jgi:lipoyl(octanoyl) transferase
MSGLSRPLVVRRWPAPVDYQPVWQAMRDFTRGRSRDSTDELWLLQHHPVYTLGVRESREDVIDAGDIALVQTDRGGLVTYHGPGQLVAYVLLDIRRLGIGLKSLVATLEQAVIDLLAGMSIEAVRRPGAPGIYVAGDKIASLGLRVVNGRTYHGLSLNVDMDLAPFLRIVPCGLEGMQMTDLASLLTQQPDMEEIAAKLLGQLRDKLGYTDVKFLPADPNTLT